MSDTFPRPPGFTYAVDKSVKSRASSAKPSSQARHLDCESVSVAPLAERFGTPLYIYSAAAIRQRVSFFKQAFQSIPTEICYSVKANSNLSILRTLGKLGCGFDVVSGGELERVLRAKHGAAKKVVFSGVGKTSSEIEGALKAGILLFNVESASELEVLARCAQKLKRTANLALRVNPDVPADTHPYISTGLQKHKFGIPIGDARALYAQAAKAKYLKVAGVSVHIGSQITSYSPFSAAIERVAALVTELRADGHTIRFVDAGGGLGISYSNGTEDFAQSINDYAKAIIAPLKRLNITLLLEPGRSIVASAGILVTRVLYRKANAEKKFLIVDAAMNDLIRPSLYQADHQIVPVEQQNSQTEIVDIVGPICESGDFFARDRELSASSEGSLLAILDAGAYGMSLASNYNSRPRAAEVLVSGKSARLIRSRETTTDLMRPELRCL